MTAQKPRQARERRTVVIDVRRYDELLAKALAAAGTRAQETSQERARLGALLKAFADAARPAGGLRLAADGTLTGLDAILAAGAANLRAGECSPRIERNIRAGVAIDERMALALLHFLRHVLDKPALTLASLGAVQADRLATARHVETLIQRGRDELPQAVVSALLQRSAETASYASLWEGYVCEYRQLRSVVDAQGVQRVRVTRCTRYRPFKLNRYEIVHRPTQTYELHDWARFESAVLEVRLLDRELAPAQAWQVPVHKRLDADRGLVVFEPVDDPQAEWNAALRSRQVEDLRDQQRVEFRWTEELVLNVADRDLVVSYHPVDRPRIAFDAAANPDFELTVGDSPGLIRVSDGWQLDRTLMPRDVLAIRIRYRGFPIEEAVHLSPSAQWQRSPARHGRNTAAPADAGP